MLLHALYIQTMRIMRVVILDLRDILATFGEELVIIQITCIARNTVVVAHIDCLGHLFTRDERFIEFLAVPRTDNPHLRLTVFRVHFCVDLLQGFGKGTQCGSRGFLNEQIPVMAVLKGIDDQIHGIVHAYVDGDVNISLLSGQTEPDPGEDTDPAPSPEPEAEPKPEPGEEAAPQDEQPQEKEAEAHEE